jgi:(1->4)-alpha-D-glucan 1-alpha-D-glucosylmutase
MTQLRATYRLQLVGRLRPPRRARARPYLRDLGISHLYLSPSLQARSGSTHGYDVVDPTRVSEALGGEDALRALAAEDSG